MTEKQFKVEVSSDNYVHFSENGVNVISIGFKEYADAEDCRNSLLPFCNRLNNLSEQNKELKKQREELFIRERNTKNELRKLKKENKELNSIKCFADNKGINIFNIDEAFRRCWNDNEKLVIKNNELQERNNRQCKQLDDLFRLIEEKDWRALTDILDDFKKADEQLQKEWKCYE